ncbi:hypothetical protein ANN_10700 [Periplaneta americana]|uniref:Ribosomal RNA-processing protein 8 n=2 Tax=Periplaneta americana TaxID=6978 RepID=A0ABQ8T4H2_PERAM|nr:hypothetical protein ANN_10700 [Periplaneta americana]
MKFHKKQKTVKSKEMELTRTDSSGNKETFVSSFNNWKQNKFERTKFETEKNRKPPFSLLPKTDTTVFKVKKKKKRNRSQDALMSPQSNVSFSTGGDKNKEIVKENKNSKQQISGNFSFNVNRLKQVIETPGNSAHQLMTKKKRKRSFSCVSDTNEQKMKKRKRSKLSHEDELLLSEHRVTKNIQGLESETNIRKQNGKEKKKHKGSNSIDTLRLSDRGQAGKKPSAVGLQSVFNIQKLKEMLAASNHKYKPANKIVLEKKQEKKIESLREKMMKKLQASRFRYLNEQLYTSSSKDAKEYFQRDPDAFHTYHEGYQQQVRQWPINPLDVIIKSLKKMSPKLVVADFGCGDARLAQSLPNKVHSFDLVAVCEEVTACDMAHTPLSSSSVDIVVFCLSLMGTNLNSYVSEANRILKEGGILKVAEVESRFENVDSFIIMLQKFGFVNTWKDFSHNLFYFMDFKKEKCISKKMKKKLPELTLKPCLYKKR